MTLTNDQIERATRQCRALLREWGLFDRGQWDDLVQEVLLGLVLRQRGHPDVGVRVRVKWLLQHAMRAMSRRDARSEQEEEEETRSSDILHHETAVDVVDMMTSGILTEFQRDLCCRVMAGTSRADIARELGITRQAVCQALWRVGDRLGARGKI